jgi:nitroreductase
MQTDPLHHHGAGSLRSLLERRRSVRAFRSDSVPADLLASLLEIAAMSPSTFNTQPWQVHVLTGATLQRLTRCILDAHELGSQPVFSPFPDPPLPQMAGRQGEFGHHYYHALGIDREDQAARGRQTARNYAFFGAPVGLLFTIDRRLKHHSWVDLGLFLQTFMLAACAAGLGTCPQVAFLRYERAIAQCLDFGAHEALVCGMSLGYPDASAPVNRMTLPRAAQSEFVRWHTDVPAENVAA